MVFRLSRGNAGIPGGCAGLKSKPALVVNAGSSAL